MSENEARDPKNWPDDISNVADTLVAIVAGADKQDPQDVVKNKDLHSLALDQWGIKDFARYFDNRCASVGIPHVIRYQRDVHHIKKIKADLDSVGRGNNSEIKKFLDWAFDNHRNISSKEGVFTLSSLGNSMNSYLQRLSTHDGDGDQEKQKMWGGNLAEEMLEEYKQSKTAGLMIAFGIPLAAAFMINANFSKSRVQDGFGDRLSKLYTDDRKADIEKIARHSITNSPYPPHFPLLDWRTIFKEVWAGYDLHAMPWWRNSDHGGSPYVDYDAFIIPRS